MTDKQVDDMCRRLGIAFGVATNDDLVAEMVTRFLQWKLPSDFSPDAGISFKAEFNENTQHPMKHEPTGTNLFDATQAAEMVRYMLGLKTNKP